MSSALTAEELKVGAEKVHRHSKYLQSTSAPKSLTGGGMGSGVELHCPKDMTEIAVLTGMPLEQKQRTVVIAPRELKTMQSGDGNSYQWTITWKNRQRWSNPLMGWTSTADPMSNVKLTFDSKDDAEAYAAKNGWKTEVRGGTAKVRHFLKRVQRISPMCRHLPRFFSPNLPSPQLNSQANENVPMGTNNYSHNFLSKRTLAEIKDQRDSGSPILNFYRPHAGSSCWFMMPTYHGDREVEQYGDMVK